MLLYAKNQSSVDIYQLIPKFNKINEFRKKQALKLNLNEDVYSALCSDDTYQVLNKSEIIFYNNLIHPGKYVGCWYHDFKKYIPNEDEVDEIIEILINDTINEYREVKGVINGEVETIKYLFLLKPYYVEQLMELYKMTMIVEVSRDFYMINKLLNSQDISNINVEEIDSTILSYFDVSFKEKNKISICKDVNYTEEEFEKSEFLLSLLLQ